MNALKSARKGNNNQASLKIKKVGPGGTGSGSGRIDTIKSLSNQQKKKIRVFGERCFDYISSCRHELTVPRQMKRKKPPTENNPDPKFVHCPFCRLINSTLKPFFENEETERMQARLESLRNRSLLRTRLLYQWSQSQPFHYQYMEMDNSVGIIWSKSFAECILRNDSLLQLIQKRKTKSSFWFRASTNDLLNEHSSNSGGNEEKLSLIDFSEMAKILSRNQRINELGQVAAVFLQSHIRKYLAKLRVRILCLTRYEFIVNKFGQKEEFFYDKLKLKKLKRKPKLIEEERPGTPTTIERRLKHEWTLKQKKEEKYFQFLKTEQLEFANNPFYSLDFFERDVKIIQYYKQLILVHDVLLIAMKQLQALQKLKKQRKEEEEKNNSANDLLSQLSSLNLTNSQKKGPEVMSNNNNNKEKGLVPEASDEKSPPIWILPSPPGLPARELGLSIALLTVTSPAAAPSGMSRSQSTLAPVTPSASPLPVKRRNAVVTAGSTAVGIGGLLNPMQRALQILEQKLWESLICSTPEEILQKLLMKDLLPIYESVLNFSQDEFGIWNGRYKKVNLSSLNATTTGNTSSFNSLPPPSSANNNASSAKNLNQLLTSQISALTASSPDLDISPTIEEDDEEEGNNNNGGNEVKDHILPFGIYLRPVNHIDFSANGFFRLFFFEEELIGISAVSPWVFYPEIWKNREAILSSIVRFVLTNPMKTSIHNIYRTANKTHPKYQQNLLLPKEDGGGGAMKRKQSIVGGGGGGSNSNNSSSNNLLNRKQ
jgi:hypothetical protein